MAEFVHLFLKASGSDIKGDSTQKSEGRDDSIECLSYVQEVVTSREEGTAVATGRRQFRPIVIRKRIDKASPLLSKALTENQELEGEFKFYRPQPTGDGTTENFYNVTIKRARLSSIKQVSPEATGPLSFSPPIEEVGFVFHTIKQTYVDGGIEHEDTWDSPR